jgi:2-methylcitrate dehydratase PrpD
VTGGSTTGARFLADLCESATEAEYADVPAVAREDAKRSIQDLLACFAAGGMTQVWHVGIDDVDQATFKGAFLAHIDDFDPVHGRSHGHPAAMLLPSLIPYYTSGRCTGADLVAAYAVGHEVMCVLGDLIGQQLRDTRKHPTCLLGAVAAAVAVGRILGLSAEAVRTAAFLAASTSTGHSASFGSAAKAYQLATAARNGRAAAHAAVGLTRVPANTGQALWEVLSAAVAPLEPADPAQVGAFGSAWRIEVSPTFHKLLPICGYLITTVAGFERAWAELALPGSEPASLSVGVPRTVAAVAEKGLPRTVDEARFALGFLLAAAAVRSVDDFGARADELIGYPDVATLTAATAVAHDPACDQDGMVRVEARLRGGGRERLLIPVGGLPGQFDPEGIVSEKWRRHLEPRVPARVAERLAAATRGLEEVAGPEWLGLVSTAFEPAARPVRERVA